MTSSAWWLTHGVTALAAILCVLLWGALRARTPEQPGPCCTRQSRGGRKRRREPTTSRLRLYDPDTYDHEGGRVTT